MERFQWCYFFLLGIYLQATCAKKFELPTSPPDPQYPARMARYIMHNSDWVSLATISTQENITGYPFVTLKSLSDGPKNEATGVPYLFMTDLDVSGQDVKKNNNVTIMATLAQSEYCKSQDFDPQDPRCAKLIISGKLRKVDKSTDEYAFAQKALYSRHPVMKEWNLVHKFYIATVTMEQIDVLDFFGGIKHVSVKDYFNANLNDISENSLEEISVITVGNDE